MLEPLKTKGNGQMESLQKRDTTKKQVGKN